MWKEKISIEAICRHMRNLNSGNSLATKRGKKKKKEKK
jgi:hypothetical protein